MPSDFSKPTRSRRSAEIDKKAVEDASIAIDRSPLELQRERIAQWLTERETERGPLTEEAISFAEEAWRKRSHR